MSTEVTQVSTLKALNHCFHVALFPCGNNASLLGKWVVQVEANCGVGYVNNYALNLLGSSGSSLWIDVGVAFAYDLWDKADCGSGE